MAGFPPAIFLRPVSAPVEPLTSSGQVEKELREVEIVNFRRE
jgi:hypothetical protein